MTALLVGLLAATVIHDAARLWSLRPAAIERRLTTALLNRSIAPALYRRRMEALARVRPARRAAVVTTPIARP